MRNIAGLVRPGGLFITAALRHSAGYVVGSKLFPSASVDEADIRRVLESGFDWDDGAIEVCDLSADRTHGYTSIVLARVRRARPTPTRRANREATNTPQRHQDHRPGSSVRSSVSQ